MAVKRFDLLLWSKANISVSWVRGCLPTARRNPVGQSILSRYFKGGISPLKLLLAALFPTLVMALMFMLLPS